jgi:hypothetical protein
MTLDFHKGWHVELHADWLWQVELDSHWSLHVELGSTAAGTWDWAPLELARGTGLHWSWNV